MLWTAAAFLLLCLLPSQEVQGLITTTAKCLSGYQWMFSSINQSPCDVAAELASVCVNGVFNLEPLPPTGYIYGGPSLTTVTECRCSSVYYSLLSACSTCQGRNFLRWSTYATNCSVVYLKVYNQNIPDKVKVPVYAYQDVSVSDTFDLTLAQTMGGTESTRLPQASFSTSATARPTTSATSPQSTGTTNNTPAIIGGVVGGLVGLGLIGALITFLLLRSRQKSQEYNSSLMRSIPGSPGTGMGYVGADDRFSYPSANMNDPNRNTVVSHITGSSAQNHNAPQNTGPGPSYYGMPEL